MVTHTTQIKIPLASNIKSMGMNNMATAVMHGETAITNTIGDGAHRC